MLGAWISWTEDRFSPGRAMLQSHSATLPPSLPFIFITLLSPALNPQEGGLALPPSTGPKILWWREGTESRSGDDR
jgi:hypothetical protein